MSRAFVKDDDDAPEPRLERPVSTALNYVTPRGLQLLRDALMRSESIGDVREVRYYTERIETAIVVNPAMHPKDAIEFGATIRAHDDRGGTLVIRIVGEDESDPLHGSISWESPIAQALTGHRVGNCVTVQRPAGPIQYTIDAITYE